MQALLKRWEMVETVGLCGIQKEGAKGTCTLSRAFMSFVPTQVLGSIVVTAEAYSAF
jgi:hypothetical protein